LALVEAKPIVRELGPEETTLAFEAMRALRTGLTDEKTFLDHVESERAEGYRLVGSFADGIRQAQAVAGFRTGHGLAWGFYLYVDDLSTLREARRRGHGGAIMDWLFQEARRLGCDSLHLDSGVGTDRTDAHRLYLNHGMHITSHHFAARP
jgi:GNAT superfamily N-acetyltransferase